MTGNTARHYPTEEPAKETIKVINENPEGVPTAQKTPFWNTVFFLLFAGYFYFFMRTISGLWFNPEYTTDDAYQQLFPFIAILEPDLFNGDVIYRMMRGYLTPIHYSLGAFFTMLTRDPIMTGHWMMLVQFSLSLLFCFLSVQAISSTAAGLFAVTWLLHTRHVIQRLTAGLPRGWAAPLLLAFCYFAVKGKHRSMLVLLFVGCLLHPPSTLIAALAYGLILLWMSFRKETRQLWLPRLRGYILLSPAYIAAVLLTIGMPEDFGSMASLEVARSMPEFASPGGRFPFVPLVPYWEEMHRFGFQAFLNKWTNPGYLLSYGIPILITLVTFGLLALGLTGKGKRGIPPHFTALLISIVLVHQLSRVLAFYLYVPNRHLQFPMAIFFVVALSAGVWRCAVGGRTGAQHTTRASLALFALGLVVVAGSGAGLDGKANFNTHIHQKGKMATWLRKYSPKDSLVAGHPTIVDPIPLIARRRLYISTEMAHPFYKGYYDQIKNRLEVSLRAHYAKSLPELYSILEPHGIDYFVFDRKQFYPEKLAKASYFRPYDQLVRELTVAFHTDYAYKKLPKIIDIEKAPFMPYRDDSAAIVDIAALGTYLKAHGAL